MKIVNRIITAEREREAIAGDKSNSFPIKFGDKTQFSTLKVSITRESCNKVQSFVIAKDYLPNNKTNTTRFYLKDTEGGVAIKWCSKVADNMRELE